MKKLLLILMAIISVSLVKAQPVSDIAIIPVGVNLNSILRLQVISGGNIEFAVNTISQYSNGIPNTAGTTTTFTVSSTVNFAVNLYAEGANMIGTDLGGSLPVTNIGYTMAETGTGADATNWNLNSVATTNVLASAKGATSVIVDGISSIAAGNAAQNTFQIKWELATPAVLGAVGGLGAANTLLIQGKKADRYVINTFLDLDAK